MYINIEYNLNVIIDKMKLFFFFTDRYKLCTVSIQMNACALKTGKVETAIQ